MGYIFTTWAHVSRRADTLMHMDGLGPKAGTAGHLAQLKSFCLSSLFLSLSFFRSPSFNLLTRAEKEKEWKKGEGSREGKGVDEE